MKIKLLAATAAGGAVLLSTVALGGTAVATGSYGGDGNPTVQGRLHNLNNSGVKGTAYADVKGSKVTVGFKAKHLSPGLPHAAHIHYGEQAAHECPTFKDDANGDFRINVAEGVPQYGPIAISLTTRGDTSPEKSALALDRFSTAPKGTIKYHRTVKTSKDVAKAIRNGEGVLVIHGIDYNNNGKYDLEGAGESEIAPGAPAEATDPAACGVLR